ncbi:VOC family protein [Gottfriedia acidiceleris]|uniref:VOC family protein n=1 Tax=Bacillaceae TaxID=186817 RepID=UPI000BEE31E3|nr:MULTISPECIES: VOC family protein [unclassified Bacillus (in: firmicutes)]PEC50802.1 glyoxalase [Bacillus sp. AFS096315]PFM80010.1 glyoxalase [Bacillus sp. AFS077874]
MLKMRYLILYVSNLEKSLTFYTESLGLPIRGNHGTYVELDTDNTVLAMIERGNVQELTGLSYKSTEASSQTFEIGFVTDDVHSTIEDLRTKGVNIIKEPITKPWGQTVAYVADPDGHFIEICSLMD